MVWCDGCGQDTMTLRDFRATVISELKAMGQVQPQPVHGTMARRSSAR